MARDHLRPATQTGPEPGRLGRRSVRVEAHVAPPRKPGRAARSAVDAGGGHRHHEPALEAAVSGSQRIPAAIRIERHPVVIAQGPDIGWRSKDLTLPFDSSLAPSPSGPSSGPPSPGPTPLPARGPYSPEEDFTCPALSCRGGWPSSSTGWALPLEDAEDGTVTTFRCRWCGFTFVVDDQQLLPDHECRGPSQPGAGTGQREM